MISITHLCLDPNYELAKLPTECSGYVLPVVPGEYQLKASIRIPWSWHSWGVRIPRIATACRSSRSTCTILAADSSALVRGWQCRQLCSSHRDRTVLIESLSLIDCGEEGARAAGTTASETGSRLVSGSRCKAQSGWQAGVSSEKPVANGRLDQVASACAITNGLNAGSMAHEQVGDRGRSADSSSHHRHQHICPRYAGRGRRR